MVVSRSFFLPQQAPLNAPRMDLNPEPLLNGPGQLPGGERGIGRQLPGDKLHHLGGQFVSSTGPALSCSRRRRRRPPSRPPSPPSTSSRASPSAASASGRTLAS